MEKHTVCALRKKDVSSLLSLNCVADGAAALLADKPPWTPALESNLAHILSHDAAPMVLSEVLLHPLIPSCMAVRLFQWACTSSPSLAQDRSISKALATSLTCPPRLPHLWPALRSLEVSPLPLPAHFFTALIKHLGEAGLPFHAKHLFFSMYCCPDVYTCTALLHAMLGCTPARTPISTSSSMLSMESVCQALSFLDQMGEMGIQPNVVTCNILISGLLRADQLKPALKVDKALAILTQMEERGCTPNTITYSILLDSLLKAKEVNKALAILTQMEKRGCTPDTVTYSSLIDGLLKAKDVDKAVAILTQMEKRGCTPDTITYSSLLNGLLKANEVNKALAILTQMEKRECTLVTVTYNSLLDGLLKANEVNKALAILIQMEKRGCTPDTITYNILLDGLLKANEVNTALAILAQMEKRGCTPDRITYNIILDGLLKDNEVNKALALLTQMEKRGCTHTIPNTVTYNIFIKWIVKQERLEDALLYLESMHSVGCEPDEATYTFLIDELLNVNKVNKALVIMTEMEKRRMLPEYSTLQRIYQLACDGVKNEDMKMFE